ncbi:hypothetical protein F4054_00755 [Candidatus Poribacteria bacterium]|nr:hypothetical protein [Candidatus Poribacteria bacterium]MYK20771.1 hypothetical protein [Candidatus Poribacteria bacterium]
MHCLKASLATLLVIGLLFNCLPSVSEAHHKKQTIKTITVTTVSTWGWMDQKNEAGETVKVFVEISRTTTTTTSTSESVIQHQPISWGTILTGGAAFITAVVAIFIKKSPPSP